ncbi:MAG TPA: PH domain-containing protein [Gaiellales bacterium]|nr:PH domain-containing protein [Gaiellales bacterium]
MEVLQGESVVWKGHPSWKALLLYYLKWTLVSLIPAAIWVGLDRAMSGPPSPTIFAALTLLGLILTYIGGWIKRATTHYTVTDNRIHIRTGLVSRREHSTQLSRVQNVNVTQTIMQRLLGIGDVDWDTAGTEEAESDFRFVGIEDPSSLVRIVDQRLHAIGH